MARSSSGMHSAFVNSLDGSSFGLNCWIDNTATGDRPFDISAVEYRNLQPHKSMMLFAFDLIPPIDESRLKLR